VRQGAEQISLDGKIARGRIGDARAAEKSDYLRTSALVSEDFGFEETKSEGPIRVACRKIFLGLLCLPLSYFQITV
jgi:hypothetical protein